MYPFDDRSGSFFASADGEEHPETTGDRK